MAATLFFMFGYPSCEWYNAISTLSLMRQFLKYLVYKKIQKKGLMYEWHDSKISILICSQISIAEDNLTNLMRYHIILIIMNEYPTHTHTYKISSNDHSRNISVPNMPNS